MLQTTVTLPEVIQIGVNGSLIVAAFKAAAWITKREAEVRAYADKLMNNHLHHIQQSGEETAAQIAKMTLNYEKQSAELIRALDDVRDEMRRSK